MPFDNYRSINAMMESFWSKLQTELLDRRNGNPDRTGQ
jgi:hypothetical protein